MYIEQRDCMKGLFSSPPVLQGRTLVLRPLVLSDAGDLERLTRQEAVYRYLPTFLFEQKYEATEVIRRLYDEGLEESLILGVFAGNSFCMEFAARRSSRTAAQIFLDSSSSGMVLSFRSLIGSSFKERL